MPPRPPAHTQVPRAWSRQPAVHTHVGTMSRCVPNRRLPSPVWSQVILGTGANATAAPNTMARALSGAPVRAHILPGRGAAGLQRRVPVGSEAAANVRWVTQSPGQLAGRTAWS